MRPPTTTLPVVHPESHQVVPASRRLSNGTVRKHRLEQTEMSDSESGQANWKLFEIVGETVKNKILKPSCIRVVVSAPKLDIGYVFAHCDLVVHCDIRLR